MVSVDTDNLLVTYLKGQGGFHMKQKCNVVLAGGGVKGIGHIGAICALEKQGYCFEHMAGSSAGAIVASFLAAGYTGEEMQALMQDIDYEKFRHESFLDHFGVIGKGLHVALEYGIYSSSYLEHWLNDLLSQKHAACFGDVKNKDGSYRLQVTISDVTDQKLLVFPQDLSLFHIDIDSFPIARAVRMSMSIPFYYEPYKLKDTQGKKHYMVDGGMLSNYPIWILDDGTSVPAYPTFGLKFISGDEKAECKQECQPCDTILDYTESIISTLLEANDNFHISRSKGDFARSILIPSMISIDGEKKKISTTDFGITKAESKALFNNGYDAAQEFLKTWNFRAWIKEYRASDK